MIVTPGNCQHIGGRASQQDAFGFSDKDDLPFVGHGGVLAIVADGMGGLANGGDASRLAVNTFLKSYMAKPSSEPIPAALLRALSDANNVVYQFAKSIGQAENVGTTLVAAVIHESNLYYVSIGDSRLYLCRCGRLTQVNEEHLYAHELDREAAAGKITQADALNHPERHALTRYVGQSKLEEIDHNSKPFPLQEGDKLLLCSDGLYAALSEQEMAQSLAGNPPVNPQSVAETLVNLVLNKQRPDQDNLTAAILDCDNDAVTARPATLRTPVQPPVDTPRTRKKPLAIFAALAMVIILGGAGLGYVLGYVGYPNKSGTVAASHPQPPDRVTPAVAAQPVLSSPPAPEQNPPPTVPVSAVTQEKIPPAVPPAVKLPPKATAPADNKPDKKEQTAPPTPTTRPSAAPAEQASPKNKTAVSGPDTKEAPASAHGDNQNDKGK